MTDLKVTSSWWVHFSFPPTLFPPCFYLFSILPPSLPPFLTFNLTDLIQRWPQSCDVMGHMIWNRRGNGGKNTRLIQASADHFVQSENPIRVHLVCEGVGGGVLGEWKSSETTCLFVHFFQDWRSKVLWIRWKLPFSNDALK